MPHLSPMHWIFIMPLMWMIVINLTVSKYKMTAPTFKVNLTTKQTSTTNSWTW